MRQFDFGGFGIQSEHILAQFLVGVLDKEVGKEEDVGTSVLEGRHVDGKLVDAVIEVLSELAFGYRLRQILVGGTDESDIHINLLRAAQRTDFSLLQGSEELHLYFVVEVSHLIEENRTAVSYLEGTLLDPVRLR